MPNDQDRRRELEEENARLKLEIAQLRQESARATARLPKMRDVGEQRTSLRAWVLDALGEAKHSLYSQYLTALYICRFDRHLAPARLGTLAADERKRVEAGRSSDVALTNGLVADSGTPIKRIWARSDWALADRIVADTSGRVLFLKTAAWVFDEAARSDEKWANPEALKLLANQLARDVPIDTRAERDAFKVWSARVHEELEKLEPRDRERREAAAEILSEALNERQLLFGAAGPLTVVPGTDEQAWKDAN